ARAGALPQPLDPGGEIVTAFVHDFIGGALPSAALRRGGAAHEIMAARVDAQYRAAQRQQTLGEGIEQGGTVKAAPRAMNQAEGIDGKRGTAGGGRLEDTIEAKAVTGGGLDEIDEYDRCLRKKTSHA